MNLQRKSVFTKVKPRFFPVKNSRCDAHVLCCICLQVADERHYSQLNGKRPISRRCLHRLRLKKVRVYTSHRAKDKWNGKYADRQTHTHSHTHTDWYYVVRVRRSTEEHSIKKQQQQMYFSFRSISSYLQSVSAWFMCVCVCAWCLWMYRHIQMYVCALYNNQDNLWIYVCIHVIVAYSIVVVPMSCNFSSVQYAIAKGNI